MKLLGWLSRRRPATAKQNIARSEPRLGRVPPLTPSQLDSINNRREAAGSQALTMEQAKTAIQACGISFLNHDWLIWYTLMPTAAAPSTSAQGYGVLGHVAAPVADVAQPSHSHASQIGGYSPHTHNLTSASDSASGSYDLGSSSSFSSDCGSSFSSGSGGFDP